MACCGAGRRAVLAGAIGAALAPRPAAAQAAPLVEAGLRLAVPPGGPRTVALTLDACGGGVDERVLATLLRLDIPATIFVTGRWLRGQPGAVARLRARPAQFLLENHGDRHLPAVLGPGRVYGLVPAGSAAAIRAEIAGGAAAIAATGAPPPRWYRGATGLYSPAAIPLIEGLGYAIAGFSLNGDEGASLPAAAVARRVAAAASGDVILAHMNQPGRAAGAGLAAGIAALQAAGARFVTLAGAPTLPRHDRQAASG